MMSQVMNKKIAYKQVYDILLLIDSSEIPEDVMQNLEEKMDKNYKFDIKNDQLLEETKDILSAIYTDYLSSDEEKEIINNLEKVYNEQIELEKKQKYGKDVFEKENDKTIENVSNQLIEKKENIFTKIINLFKGILK